MNPSHGVSPKAMAQIVEVLARFGELETAVLFGSRAKGTHRQGSDIDLALVGAPLDWRTVGQIYDALDDLLLPYRFSLIVHDVNTDPEVAGHLRWGIPIFQRAQASPELLGKK